ncbi:MAG: CDP-diacylglycerol--glycerol-3-phosphate 3-phosphatidyltransferase [Bacteroidota bacterium]
MQIITPPNSVTFLRILLTPLFAFLFLENDFDSSFYALLTFIFAGITDWYDGWLARKWKYDSRFGNFFDPLADKILISTAFLLFSFKGYMPFWMTALIIFRDLLITFLRMISEYQSKPFNTSFFAKTKTALQMFSIYYVLCYHIISNSPNLNKYFTNYMNPFSPIILQSILFVVTIITAWTGFVYLSNNRNLIKSIFKNEK